RRDRQAIEPLHRFEGRARYDLVLLNGFRPHRIDPFQVGARLKMPAIALEHHDAQRRLPAELVHRSENAVDQTGVIGVVDLRTVERNGCDPARVEVPQDGIWHGWSLGADPAVAPRATLFETSPTLTRLTGHPTRCGYAFSARAPSAAILQCDWRSQATR